MNLHVADGNANVVPFSLKDAPSLIERIFPSMKISAEAQKERKANVGQTLTVLGAYWKGRKPLILVKACVLGCLLPATEDHETDLHIFELLMGISDDGLAKRVGNISPRDIDPNWIDYFRLVSVDTDKPKWRRDLPKVERSKLLWKWLESLPYEERLQFCLRPEEIEVPLIDEAGWSIINSHLGTRANSLQTLVEQLGICRYGHRPRVADTFSGGGSIPFEAARIGCDAFASDLNPVACMLSWGAFNIVGASSEQRSLIDEAQRRVISQVEAKVEAFGIERDEKGNRAKAFLYCLEVRCPESGWLVPLAPSWVISQDRKVIAKLQANMEARRYDIEIITGVSAAEMKEAAQGTVRKGRIHHPTNPNPEGVAISAIRGDYRLGDGRSNRLRLWDKLDFVPRIDDVWQERLYCVQWITEDSFDKSRQDVFFSSVTESDLVRERKVEEVVFRNLRDWQAQGFIPEMAIEAGENTSQPIKERGWTYWHHLFGARQLLVCGLLGKAVREENDPLSQAALALSLAKGLDRAAKLCQWSSTPAQDIPLRVFVNQALNTLANWGVRATSSFLPAVQLDIRKDHAIHWNSSVVSTEASKAKHESDIIVTDPPYADAVNYHEITEYFIAWLRKNPPKLFRDWQWDSRRRLAIKGKGEEFRTEMVAAYKAMADHMPNNGIQVVMFTHQDGKVWSDMTQIFWGAGLQVMADWYIATETTSELKKGGYVQGTHCIILRKRPEALSGYSDEISQEVKEAVAVKIEEMVGLNQTLRGHGRSENVFNDADLQMAGYAAALRVLTSYAKIDGKDMTVEAMRPRMKNERTIVDDVIEYAVQVANEHLVPDAMDGQTWQRLTGIERFYLKMLDIESTGARKVDNYQNFAKAFRVADHSALMASEKANDASLKSAANFGKRQMGTDEFGSSLTRAVLYALWELGEGIPDDDVLDHIHGLVPNYFERRADLQVIARYISMKRRKSEPKEADNAEILAGIIRNERLG